MADLDDFVRLIEPVARLLLGEPNEHLSTKGRELRFGSRGSMSVDLEKATWIDHESNEGGGFLDLVTLKTGRQGKDRFDWLDEHGFHIGDDHHHRSNGGGNGAAPKLGKIVATYDYTDEEGALLFQVVRFDPKDFRQRKPDKSDPSGWSWKIKGVRQVPYRLNEVIEAVAKESVVCIVEGEKDADNLWDMGVPATTNAGGCGKWRRELSEFFRDADVIVIQDNDPQTIDKQTGKPLFHEDGRPKLPGQDHAQQVALDLSQVAHRVRVLDLAKRWTDMPLKGDVTDWIKAGGTSEALFNLADLLPDWKPVPLTVLHQQRKATPYIAPEEACMPMRKWLHGNHYMRGIVTSTVAPGGFGKTTLSLHEAITMAVAGYRVWYISAEDDRDELDRRIAAHLKKHNIKPMDFGQRLFVDDKASFPLKIAQAGRNGAVFDAQALEQFENAIAADKIDVVILDPFISFHYLNENDTASMDALVKRLGEIAQRHQCCIELSHHVRKPSMGQVEITVYDARGAGAIVNAVRSCRVLNQMTTIAADIAKIPHDERFRYIRIDSGKRNMAPPESARWVRLVNIGLDNGDYVQALEEWTYPIDVTAPDDPSWLRLMLDKPLRVSSQSPQWLGLKVAERHGLDVEKEGDIKTINKKLKRWASEGLLKQEELPDENRIKRPYWVLGDKAKLEKPTEQRAINQANQELQLPLSDE